MLKVVTAILGFVIFAVVAIGSVDFVSQARQEKKGILEFGLDGWMQSFAERGAAAGAEKRAAKAVRTASKVTVGRDMLPEAPAGWYRVPYAIEHEHYINDPNGGRELSREDIVELQRNPADKPSFWKTITGGYDAMFMSGIVRDAYESSYVYIRGNERIILAARPVVELSDREPTSIAEYALWEMRREEELMGMNIETRFARYGGVQFTEVDHDHWYLGVEGIVGKPDGPQIEIKAKARSQQSTLKSLLRRIDYTQMRTAVGKATPHGGTGRAASSAVEAELRAAADEMSERLEEIKDDEMRVLRAKSRAANGDLRGCSPLSIRAGYCN